MDENRPRRLIYIGIDGAVPDFITKFAAEGKLPTFETLMARGVFATTFPVAPCDTPTNWSTLQTGCYAGTHEVVSFFVHRPGEPLDVAHETTNSWSVRAENLWEAAERQGKHCIVLNWPCSWPSRLKQGIQVDGTGPLSPVWRITYGRAYVKGDIGGRMIDEVILKEVGGVLTEPLDLRPAHGWKNAPDSHRPLLEAELSLTGDISMRWSEIGMQVDKDISGSPLPAPRPGTQAYYCLVVDSQGQGYDRVFFSPDRDAANAVPLKEGEWSPWLQADFQTRQVLQHLVPDDRETVPCVFRYKLVTLSADAENVALHRTDIWTADGWSFPAEMAAEISANCGPFTEGLELPPPISRAHDEWETYAEQLEQACQWYVRAAGYLTTNYPWDILALQLHSQDGINHVLAREICPEAPEYTPERAAQAWSVFEASYRAIDRMVGGILERCADEDTLVVVLSDHGAIPTLKRCSVAGALVRAGLLAYRWDASGSRWVVDFSRSKVFPRRTHIWVNLRGRDPDGIVPPDEFEAVRTAAITAMQSIRDPKTEEAPVEIVLRKEDAAILGLWGNAVGDLMFWMKPSYTDADLDYGAFEADPRMMPDVGETQVGCAHHQYLPSARFGIWNNAGMFFMQGPGIKRGYARPHPMWQVDVVPTVCHLLGLRPPKDVEGRVLWDVQGSER